MKNEGRKETKMRELGEVIICLRVLTYGATKHPEFMDFGKFMEQIPIDLGFTSGDFNSKILEYQKTRQLEIAPWDFNSIMDAMLKELGF